MSAALYEECIFWVEHRGGRARNDGVEVHLHRAPQIGKLRPRLVEFAPEVQMFRIAETDADPPRDMTAEEITAAKWYLTRMSAGARAEVG
jgi:hypothetical protein